MFNVVVTVSQEALILRLVSLYKKAFEQLAFTTCLANGVYHYLVKGVLERQFLACLPLEAGEIAGRPVV